MSGCDPESVTTLDTRPDDLVVQLASVEAALSNEFPAADADLIRSYVAQEYEALTPAKVNTFLPIFVARRARARVRADALK